MSWDFEKHYINGEWTPSEDDAWIEVENPWSFYDGNAFWHIAYAGSLTRINHVFPYS